MEQAVVSVGEGGGQGRSEGLVKWAMWVGLLLLVVVFLVFAVYYAGYRKAVSMAPPTKRKVALQQQKTIRQLVLSIFSLMIFFVVSLALVCLGVLGLRKVEQKNLFAPVKLDRYRKLSGMIYSLPSGGLVLNTTPNAPSNARRILFLHGNTGNLELYKEALDKIAEYGYNVFALEYRGYGPAKMAEIDGEPNAKTVVQDALEAWNLMGTSDSIVAGFSLGGAILAQVYEKFVPAPAQIVFLNSFGDLKQLLEDKLGNEFGGTCAPLMATKWSIQAPKTYQGHVLVVFTADDLTVPAKHGERLCQVFSKSKLVCRELPRGGHKYSVFTFAPHWIPELLPPALPQP